MVATIAGWTLTEHARQRMQQRAVKPWMVRAALEWGEETFDQGLQRFTVTDKALENTPYEALKEQLRGLCVVVNPAEGLIVTVKWCEQLRGLCVVVNPAEGLIVTVKWCERLRRRRNRFAPSPRRSVKNFAAQQRKEKWAWETPTITCKEV